MAPLAWVQIPVTAFCPPWGYINFLTHITWNKKTIIIYSVQTGTIRFTTKTYFNFIVRYGVVGNISACHADARGSIPRTGAFFCTLRTHYFLYIFFVFIYFNVLLPLSPPKNTIFQT